MKTNLLAFLLSVFFISGIRAQHKHPDEKASLYFQNVKTHRSKEIKEGNKVKYWLYKDSIKARGRIEQITDSSIFIKQKEIKIKDIRKIGLRKNSTIPLAVGSLLLTPVIMIYGPVLFLGIMSTERNLDLTRKWKFNGTYIPVFDSARVAEKKEKEKFQNDTSSSLSLIINPSNCLFNQQTLEIGYKMNNKYAFSIGGGVVTRGTWYHIFYNGTDVDYPTGVYKGWVASASLRRLNVSWDHLFIETNFFYKYLYYDHEYFRNSWGDNDPDVQWIRSEIAHVYGVKLLVGKRVFICRGLIAEPFLGVSIRKRDRSYITYWSNHIYTENFSDPWGLILHRNQVFPGIQMGVKLSLGNLRLNKR